MGGNLRSGCRISSNCRFPLLAGCYGNDPQERERIEYLCKRIAGVKNPQEFDKLAVELNDLASVGIEYLCERIEGEKNPKEIEKLAVELNDLVSAIVKSIQP